MSDVPPDQTMVKLTLTGNMSTGGISIDRTFEAHPENVEIAEEAARVIGLDIAGIDFICPDITEPVRETGGAICEVNAAPGFRMHTHPTVGDPQFISKSVVDMLFPPGAPSRIPIVAVTGTNGKTTTSRMIAHIFKGMGRKVGMTSTDGVVIDERLVIRADASGPKSARMVLQNPRVDFAVFEVARGGILREGLGYERNDVAVVLNVQPDHLGLRGVDTVEQLADVKAVPVEAVPRNGHAVLNADDPLVRAMRRRCSGEVVWFSMAVPGSEVRDFIDAHCRRGGKAVVLESSDKGDMIVVRHGNRQMQLAWTHLLPATFGGRAVMNVQNSLAAAAAAFAAGAPLHDIRQGLRTLLDQLLPVPRPAQPDRDRRRQRRHRLLPQRAGHADARGLRRQARRQPAQPPATWPSRHGSASSPPPVTGATRTCSSSARSPQTTSTSSSSARTSPCAVASAARRRRWSPTACAEPDRGRGALQAGGARPRRDRRRPPRDVAGQQG